MRKNASIELNQVQHTAEDTGVPLTFSVTLPDGSTRVLLVLVNSRAQVNLVNPGIRDQSHLCTSSQPIRLRVANRSPMIGGTEEANLSLQFWQNYAPQVDSSAMPAEISHVFYEADIWGYNLICGCPFMVNNSMGSLPHRQCLVMESEDDVFYLLPRSQRDVCVVERTPPSMQPDVLPDQRSQWIATS